MTKCILGAWTVGVSTCYFSSCVHKSWVKWVINQRVWWLINTLSAGHITSLIALKQLTQSQKGMRTTVQKLGHCLSRKSSEECRVAKHDQTGTKKADGVSVFNSTMIINTNKIVWWSSSNDRITLFHHTLHCKWLHHILKWKRQHLLFIFQQFNMNS